MRYRVGGLAGGRRSSAAWPYALDETAAIWQQVAARDPEFRQALQFILLSGARIDEVLHLRADKVFLPKKKVELLGKPAMRWTSSGGVYTAFAQRRPASL